jgi:hypothetical protein
MPDVMIAALKNVATSFATNEPADEHVNLIASVVPLKYIVFVISALVVKSG